MNWEYEYNDNDDNTVLYYKGEKIGTVDGEIGSLKNGLPTGEAKEVIEKAVDDPMAFDLMYGFSKADTVEE